MTQTRSTWRGCRLAARSADYWHAAHDFASATLCGIPLDGAGMTERGTRGMEFCRACDAAYQKELAAPRVYCTKSHAWGEHDASCMPGAEPGNPELRLLRAIFGLCPDHDQCTPADHPEDPS